MKAAQLMGPGLLEINGRAGPGDRPVGTTDSGWAQRESATPISISCTFRTRCAKNR